MTLIKKWSKETHIKEVKLMIKYLVSINILTFLFYGLDKFKAIKNKERISEFALLLLAFFAPFGAILGMIIFHHKTKKLKFRILTLLFAIINIIIDIKILS